MRRGGEEQSLMRKKEKGKTEGLSESSRKGRLKNEGRERGRVL